MLTAVALVMPAVAQACTSCRIWWGSLDKTAQTTETVPMVNVRAGRLMTRRPRFWQSVLVEPNERRCDTRVAWIVRICLSAVYAADLTFRGVLARRPVRYALAHSVALASVVIPPVRVILSLRLARSMFQRNNQSGPGRCVNTQPRPNRTP
jgi:hypothetical protein